MKNTKHYLAAITAFTIWGFFSLVLRPLQTYPSLDILFYRVFVSGGLMLLVGILLRRKVWTENRQHFAALSAAEKKGLLFQLFGGGLFLTANWYFFIYVTNEVSIKASAFAYLVCPVLTTVLAWAILKEHLSRGQWVAVLLSATGCGILAVGHLTDLLYSLLIAFSYALYLVSQRKNYGADRFLLLSGQILFSALLLLPFYPVYHGLVPVAGRFYILIAVIAVFLTIFPLWLNLYALKGLRSSTVGILLYINPVLGFMLALTVFGEKVDALQLSAYGVIVLAVVLFNWFNPAIRAQAAAK
ncbi:EamA family transporter [Puia dinghuensis]|uniref:Permease n=1 Tax=Puia dinghuensis TaxID=1792502 RepID=A0A8J2XRZ2_9BACT|nr:EamA family transporter [Puia dinghuensis]GGA88850.1 permease [Puia dinghuensis]